MCLILVTGHALAVSPPVQRLVVRIAQLPRTSAGAAALVAVIACLAAVSDGARGAGGVMIQFPLSCGVLGVLRASDLIRWLSEGRGTSSGTRRCCSC